MYALLSRIENGLEPLRHKFEEHVKNSGLAAVAKVLGEGTVDAIVSFRITDLWRLDHTNQKPTRNYIGAENLR